MLKVKDIKVRYITDEEGHPSEVVMPISEFEMLLEDLQDIAVVAERREEEPIDHQQLMDELKDAGII